MFFTLKPGVLSHQRSQYQQGRSNGNEESSLQPMPQNRALNPKCQHASSDRRWGLPAFPPKRDDHDCGHRKEDNKGSAHQPIPPNRAHNRRCQQASSDRRWGLPAFPPQRDDHDCGHNKANGKRREHFTQGR